jgi:hypothetical protein
MAWLPGLVWAAIFKMKHKSGRRRLVHSGHADRRLCDALVRSKGGNGHRITGDISPEIWGAALVAWGKAMAGVLPMTRQQASQPWPGLWFRHNAHCRKACSPHRPNALYAVCGKKGAMRMEVI